MPLPAASGAVRRTSHTLAAASAAPNATGTSQPALG